MVEGEVIDAAIAREKCEGVQDEAARSPAETTDNTGAGRGSGVEAFEGLDRLFIRAAEMDLEQQAVSILITQRPVEGLAGRLKGTTFP